MIPAPRLSVFLKCAVLVFAGMGAGCTSVEKRIEQRAEVFGTYPPEVQNQLRSGNIALGYDMQMVEIAKGKPNSIHVKKDGDGERIIWRYVELRQYTRTVPVHDSRYSGTRWVNVSDVQEREVLRVEFHDGRVSGFEEAR